MTTTTNFGWLVPAIGSTGWGASMNTMLVDLDDRLYNRVNLQATTPGTAQTGHLNISGTAKIGAVSAAASVTAGSYLSVGTYADITGPVGIGVAHDATKAPLYVLDASVAQLRLAHAATKYADFTIDSSGVLTINTSGDIMKQAAGESFRSQSFTSGVNGFSINANGDAEFNNVRVRGELAAFVFKISELAASNGTIGIFPSATTLYADVTTPASTGVGFNFDAKNSDAGGMLLAVNDVVRLKTWTGAGISDAWATVTARTNHSTYATYTATLNSGSTSATFRAGTAIADYGLSGAGAITLSADGTVGSSANLTVATHAGSPWSALTGRVRLGNLNGVFDYASDTYGLIAGNDIGQGAANFKGFAADQTNGLRLYNVALSNYLSGVQTVNIQPTGLFLLGTNVATAAGTVFLVTPSGGSWGAESLAAGSILLGPNTGGNVLWDASNLHVRAATTQITSFLSAPDSLGYYARFRRPFELTTTSGIGAFSSHGSGGTFTNPGPGAVGGKFYNDGAGNLVIDFHAFSGNRLVRLQSTGIILDAGSATNILSWQTLNGVGGSTAHGIASDSTGNMTFTVNSNNAGALPYYHINVRSQTADATNVQFHLQTYGGNGYGWAALYGISATPTQFDGLSIGSATAPTAGYMLDLRGNLYLGGAASQAYVNFGTVGINTPTSVTRSAGTRLVLYPNVGTAPNADFAIGVSSSTVWFSTGIYNNAYDFWHGSDYRQMRLIGDVNGNGGSTSVIDYSTRLNTTNEGIYWRAFYNNHSSFMGETGIVRNGSTGTAYLCDLVDAGGTNRRVITSYASAGGGAGSLFYTLISGSGAASSLYAGGYSALEVTGGRTYLSGLASGDQYVLGLRNGSSGSVSYITCDTSGQLGLTSGGTVCWTVNSSGQLVGTSGYNAIVQGADFAAYNAGVFRFYNSGTTKWGALQYDSGNNRLGIFSSAGGGIGAWNETTGAYTALSDERRKTDFREFDALVKIRRLSRIKEWFWKQPGSDEPDEAQGLQVGPTAQSMRHEAGYGTDETLLDVGLPGKLALAGVQQLLDQLDTAMARIAGLEARLAALGG